MELFWSILQVVLLPIVLGVVAQRLLGDRVRHADVLPLVSVVSIVIIVTAVVAASQAKIAESGLLIMAVMLHNSFGYLLGYFTGRLFKLPLAQRKSLALEVGMQNSGLAAAQRALSPLAAVPSVVQRLAQHFRGVALDVFPAHEREEDRIAAQQAID
jgi:BASS family bile acid:Na+ symporter